MAELRAGAAVIDITPPAGLKLAGFAARSEPSTGMHDPLTVRALVVGDTAILAADVIGIQKDMSERIRNACDLPAANVVIAATHTHGAPTSMPSRLAMSPDPKFLAALEAACVSAINAAARTSQPATMEAGYGVDPCVAHNRRHEDGPLDRAVPIVKVRAANGNVIAILISYACHPTVLGADNTLMTADFPHYLRLRLEQEHPGAVAIFVNGCTGDANIGHTAQASMTTSANATRTFENAERLGVRIAESALAAETSPSEVPTVVTQNLTADLPLERVEGDLLALADAWASELYHGTDPVRGMLLRYWIRWARENANTVPGQITGRVSLTEWGDIGIIALPGEVFAETSLSIRAVAPHRVLFVISYADDTPGYIPPRSEFPFGGYEVEEAYRFVGLPGRFAPGCAEKLAETAQELLNRSERGAR